MAKEWYILHTYSGYEAKIERTIRMLIEQEKEGLAEGKRTFGSVRLSEVVSDVKVPEEVYTELKQGKKKTLKKKFLPGYMLIEMDLPTIGWKEVCSQIRQINGVTGFLGATGASTKPQALSADEAKDLLQKIGEIKGDKQARVSTSFSVGQKVKIKDGALSSFEGEIEEVITDRNKLKITVEIFGRSTPVEVDMIQVELV